jgi:hypothetical protein
MVLAVQALIVPEQLGRMAAAAAAVVLIMVP